MEAFPNSEQEAERRRSLLRAAGNGNTSAQQELEREYHVRIYSALERQHYVPAPLPEHLPMAVQRRLSSVIEHEEPDMDN
jgi:hypothetical protein